MLLMKEIDLVHNMFNGPNGVGKGDRPRNMKISKEEFDKRRKKIFNDKKLNGGKKSGNRSK